jgi:hypothetical protein
MTKGVVYYTHNELDPLIMSVCQTQLRQSFDGELVSVSLKPMDFGRNIVLNELPSYVTMLKQILAGLEVSTAESIFLAEHDVLYHPSHFEFDPPSKDIYYYNVNVWLWDYPNDRAITYNNIRSQSGLCADRQLLIQQYKKRLDKIFHYGWEQDRDRSPHWARRMGFEPGTKTRRQGGISDESAETWRSIYPNLDIRHNRTATPRRVSLVHFKHPPDPKTWQEITINKIPGWWGDVYPLEKVRERFV